MIVLLLLLFNWYLLFCVLGLFYSFVGTYGHHDQIFAGVVSFVVVVGIALIFNSNTGQWLLRLTSGARKAIDREHRQLDPVIERVQNAIKEKHGLTPLNLHLMIIDDPVPNALAIGKNTLVVSRGLYETTNEDELAGVIAHEMGHLHNGDSHRLGIAWGVSVVSLSIAFLANFLLLLTSATSKVSTNSDTGIAVAMFSLFFAAFGLFLMVFVWMGNGIFKLAMLFQGRKQESLADEFAIKAGFGNGLLAFLEKIKDMHWEGQRGLMSRMYATHPPVMLRIGELERVMQQ